jgi:hypothetical protein
VQEKNVAQMRLQALRLLGSGTRIGDEGCDSFLKLDQVGESVARSLANKALDEVLMPTLKIAGDTCPNYMVKLIVSKAPELAAIRAVLGREDSTEKDNMVLRGGDPFDPPLPKNPMEFTWYKYGTLHFGVMAGKVRVLRAYSKPPTGNEKR